MSTILRRWPLSARHTCTTPHETKAGDVRVHFELLNWPFLLRPVDGTHDYQLLGQSYLHGYMQREQTLQGRKTFLNPINAYVAVEPRALKQAKLRFKLLLRFIRRAPSTRCRNFVKDVR
jgi:hypothetical protein